MFVEKRAGPEGCIFLQRYNNEQLRVTNMRSGSPDVDTVEVAIGEWDAAEPEFTCVLGPKMAAVAILDMRPGVRWRVAVRAIHTDEFTT